VLLSPFDLAAFYGGKSDEVIGDRRNRIVQDVDRNIYDLVDMGEFSTWPVSSRTLLRATEMGGPWDLFPTRNGSAGAVSSIACPLVIALGSNDFAATPSIEAAAAILADSGIACQIVAGAPHNFAGRINELESTIKQFLNTEIGSS
jgi:hypothetical protein